MKAHERIRCDCGQRLGIEGDDWLIYPTPLLCPACGADNTHKNTTGPESEERAMGEEADTRSGGDTNPGMDPRLERSIRTSRIRQRQLDLLADAHAFKARPEADQTPEEAFRLDARADELLRDVAELEADFAEALVEGAFSENQPED